MAAGHGVAGVASKMLRRFFRHSGPGCALAGHCRNIVTTNNQILFFMAFTPRFVCGGLRIARGEMRLNGLELAPACNVCGALSPCVSDSCGRMQRAAAACKACYTGANFLVSWSAEVSFEISSVYRFGLFEVDPRDGELRKSGVKLKLQDQPFKVLLKLLQRPGELVTREELRAGLWQEDTFVDFETGLNTAIKRLRETLGDSADNPRFIETLPRRGYRFIAPVEKPGVPDLGNLDAKQDSPQARKTILKIPAILVGAAALVVAWRSSGAARRGYRGSSRRLPSRMTEERKTR